MIETTRLPWLEEQILVAAERGGLPALNSSHATFDGESLTWAWREFRFDETVAADVRLRVATEELDWPSLAERYRPRTEPNEHVQASVSGLAWPVDPKLRHLSRLAFSASRDAWLTDSHEEEQLWRWLSLRLHLAWERAQTAAADVLVDIKRQHPNDATVADSERKT